MSIQPSSPPQLPGLGPNRCSTHRSSLGPSRGRNQGSTWPEEVSACRATKVSSVQNTVALGPKPACTSCIRAIKTPGAAMLLSKAPPPQFRRQVSPHASRAVRWPTQPTVSSPATSPRPPCTAGSNASACRHSLSQWSRPGMPMTEYGATGWPATGGRTLCPSETVWWVIGLPCTVQTCPSSFNQSSCAWSGGEAPDSTGALSPSLLRHRSFGV